MSKSLHPSDNREEFRVTTIKPINNAGNIKAFASVRLGPAIVDGFKVVQQSEQKAWVSVPQEKGSDGNYYNRVHFEREDDLAAVRAAILKIWGGRDEQ